MALYICLVSTAGLVASGDGTVGLWTAASERGDVDAMIQLAAAYNAGTSVVEQDLEKALLYASAAHTCAVNNDIAEQAERACRELAGLGKNVFLDFKLHDIGATVEKATRSIG